jgi:hypothetical protein
MTLFSLFKGVFKKEFFDESQKFFHVSTIDYGHEVGNNQCLASHWKILVSMDNSGFSISSK